MYKLKVALFLLEILISLLIVSAIQAQTGGTYDGQPVWSPDGRFIAFTSDRTGQHEVWLMQPDVGEPSVLTHGLSGYKSDLSWSPDSQYLLFTVISTGHSNIWKTSVDGQTLINLTAEDSSMNGAASWSPSGDKIVFVSDRDGNLDLWLMDSDGSNIKNLSNGNELADIAPTWSPDGRITYTSEQQDNSYLMVYSLEDGTTAILHDNAGSAVWSSDSRYLAFEHFPSTKQSDVVVIDFEKSTITNLTNSVDTHNYGIVWSADENSIYFVSDRSGRRDLWLQNLDGSASVNLTLRQDGESFAPSLSPDGKIIAFQSSFGDNNDIWIMDADGSNPKNLTNRDQAEYQ